MLATDGRIVFDAFAIQFDIDPVSMPQVHGGCDILGQ
jgi:hypothetical protein